MSGSSSPYVGFRIGLFDSVIVFIIFDNIYFGGIINNAYITAI